MATCFIVNPASGKHALWKVFSESGACAGARVILTERRGHASELAREALRIGCERIVAVGGDGTLSETAHGLLSSGHLPAGLELGHLPAGSGCDFARHFRLPTDPGAWKDFLDRAKPVRLDVGRVTWGQPPQERFFVNVAMAGLAGDIAHSMEISGKPLGGTASYLAMSLVHLVKSKARKVSLIVDGREWPETPYHMLALANTSSTGGGMKMAPDADPADGMLDLVAVGDVGVLKLLWNFPKIYKGSHLSVFGIAHSRVMRLDAESREKVLLNIDGEAVGELPARFQVVPKALPVLLPG